MSCRGPDSTLLGSKAGGAIDPIFLDTPLYQCEALERELGCTVSIKLETANPVRSFKARGTELVASLLADKAREPWCAPARATSAKHSVGPVAAVASTSRSWHRAGRPPPSSIASARSARRLELVDGDFEMARERAVGIAR